MDKKITIDVANEYLIQYTSVLPVTGSLTIKETRTDISGMVYVKKLLGTLCHKSFSTIGTKNRHEKQVHKVLEL